MSQEKAVRIPLRASSGSRRTLDERLVVRFPALAWVGARVILRLPVRSRLRRIALAEGGVYRGHDGARRYMSDLDDAWEIGRAEVDDALEIANVAVLVGRIHYRGKGSGVESASPAGWMLKFRNGKVLCFRAFRAPEQALEAVGLSE